MFLGLYVLCSMADYYMYAIWYAALVLLLYGETGASCSPHLQLGVLVERHHASVVGKPLNKQVGRVQGLVLGLRLEP